MRPRPVILILIKGLGLGGAERLISEAASHWDRDRFDYRVAYILPWKDQLVPEIERLDIPVTLLGGKRGASLNVLYRLRRFIRQNTVALVHAHLPSAGIIARVTSPVPVIYTEHNLVGSYRLPTRILNRISYGMNSRVVAVSHAVADAVASYPGPPVRVIPNGVSIAVAPEEAAAVRAELGIPPDGELVVHVGNIRPHKGHSTLVAAAGWLADHRPGVVVASIGGEKNPGDLERVQALAVAKGAERVLRFLGRREDARAFLAAANVVVNPSDVEGLPVVLLEAMALAKPVVATAVGGVPALIEHEKTGILVPPGDAEALGASVDRMLADPVLGNTLGTAARLSVQLHHGLESMVRAVESLYDEVLNG